MLAFAQNKTPFITSVLEAQPGPGYYKPHGVGRTEFALPYSQGSIGRIKKMFKKVELSVSSYDTAWLAMVPTVGSPQNPCFPQCLKWLLDNQHHDGSWCVPSRHDLMIKDSLMSTLACVLALRQWEIGEDHVSKGLEFLGSNFGAVMDKKQLSPMGFNIIFPSMAEHAKDLGLKLPLSPNFVDKLHKNRNLELERVSRCNTKGSKSYLAYVSEGLNAEAYDPREILKYQRKNGSLFNSPATTAALLLHSRDDKCLEYLHSLLDKYSSAVPTIYPIDVYIRLCMVDRIKRLGISRHFEHEIKSVLDETYRCWLQRDEEIFLDMQTCALAFRLLKTNGYEVSSDALADFNEEKHFIESSAGDQNLKNIYSVLELYKASEITTSPDDLVLETLHSWTSHFLKCGLENGAIPEENFRKQVENALEFPYYVNLDRLDNRRNIEAYNVDEIQILKALHRCTNIANGDFLQLAVDDYNFCQYLYQNELKNLERWVKESRFDQLDEYARQKLITYAHFLSASILFSPELSDARISWTKNTFLITIVDDFFDSEGSREELVNLIDLVEKWDCISVADYRSIRVEIIYTALYKTINELGAIAFTQQGRNVTSHLVDLWLALLKAMMQEFELATDMSTPTLNEYIENSRVSIGICPCVLITIYFLGSKLSEEILTSQECSSLYKFTGICCRLLNDSKTFQREAGQGKLNSVLLYAIHASGNVTEQEAVEEINKMIECNKRDLLKLVLHTKGSIVPKACKDHFWNTYKVSHFLYWKNDGFNSPVEMLNYAKGVIFEPIKLL